MAAAASKTHRRQEDRKKQRTLLPEHVANALRIVDDPELLIFTNTAKRVIDDYRIHSAYRTWVKHRGSDEDDNNNMLPSLFWLHQQKEEIIPKTEKFSQCMETIRNQWDLFVQRFPEDRRDKMIYKMPRFDPWRAVHDLQNPLWVADDSIRMAAADNQGLLINMCTACREACKEAASSCIGVITEEKLTAEASLLLSNEDVLNAVGKRKKQQQIQHVVEVKTSAQSKGGRSSRRGRKSSRRENPRQMQEDDHDDDDDDDEEQDLLIKQTTEMLLGGGCGSTSE